MTKYLRISSYIRKHFLIYDFASLQPLRSEMRKILFSFLSVNILEYLTGRREEDS